MYICIVTNFDNTLGLKRVKKKQFRQIYAIARAIVLHLNAVPLSIYLSRLKCCAFEAYKWKAHYLIWFILICRELVYKEEKNYDIERNKLHYFLSETICCVCVCLCRFFFYFEREKKMCNVDKKKSVKMKQNELFLII